MNRSRQAATLFSASSPVARAVLCHCEPLEPRRLLDASDPVLVLVESISDDLVDAVIPYLWENPNETYFDPHVNGTPGPDNEDDDENGYPDDYYGWNFKSLTYGPKFVPDTTDGHGTDITEYVLEVLDNGPQDLRTRVKIMYVVTNTLVDESPALQYILDKKDEGVNIVAIGAPPSITDRDGAAALALKNIMLIGGYGDNSLSINHDSHPGNEDHAFFSATPRFGVQAAPLDNVFPVTTDSRANGIASHGINSFYAGVAKYDGGIGPGQLSFAGPQAAAMAAMAVAEYQDAHSGQNPSIQQIKRAMMSGVEYLGGLNDKTITHDYGVSGREDGGVLVTGRVLDAINENHSFGVSMTQTGDDWLGTTVEFDLVADNEPTNWTISWGDNSFDGSGLEVVPGTSPTASHPFPFDNVPHHYFPTIYAMVGTGENRQVYLQESQLQVTISTPFDASSGSDHYVLSYDSVNNKTVLTLGTTTHSFSVGELPRCYMALASNDKLTIDFSNGNPLASTALTVRGSGVVHVIGTSGNDHISAGSVTGPAESFEVDAGSFTAQFTVEAGLAVSLEGAGGDDTLAGQQRACTLVGGLGDDSLNARPTIANSVLLQGGDDDDTITVNSTATLGATVQGGAGDDTITGGGGADSITGGDGTDSLTGGAGNDCLYGGNGGDGLWGGDGNDRLFGDAGDDGIYGENGNDSITGGSGCDYMSGGAGNDDFNAQDGEIDTLDGGSGWDTGFIDFGEFIMDEEFGLETLFY